MPDTFNLLLIEESERDASAILKELRSGGFEPSFRRVETAGELAEALGQGGWEMVIGAYVLARFDGMEALRMVQAKDPGLPFLMISGVRGEEYAVEVIRSGARDFILKGLPGRLVPAVRRELRDHQERLELRRVVQEREERFRQLADAMPHLVWTARPDGTVDYYNLRREEFSGILKNPDGTWRWIPILHPDDIAPTVAAWENAFRTGAPYEIEHRVQRADGSIRWYLSRATPVRDDEGRIVRWYGTATDIDDLKRAETDLRQSEERFRAFFENAAVGAMEMDLEARLIKVNEHFCRITGFSREELLGRSPHDLTHPEDRERQKAEFEKLLEGDLQVLEIDKRYVRRDGGIFWVLETTGIICDQDGKKQRLAGIVQDITERRKAEMEGQRLLAELEATILAMASGVVIYGFEGDIRRMNPAAENIFRYSSEAASLPMIERKSLLKPIDEEDRPYDLRRLPAVRALRGETVLSEIVGFHRPGTEKPLWVAMSAAPIMLADGRIIGAVSTLTDITPLRELQKEREIFIHMVSHDLRTPLAVVMGHAEMMDAGCGQEDMQLHIEAILSGAERMNSMIEDLVDAARLEGGEITLEKERVHLFPFVSDLLRRDSTALQTSRVVIEMSPEAPPVCADPERLERILTNLLTNALKYSPPKSLVTVGARPETGEVLLFVRDSGQGIQPRDLPHIFDRYFRPSSGKKADSVGLGLYITRSLVEAHGGRVWAESEPGRGSTFYFTLPATSPEE